jgi:hypothetical protein
VETAPGGLRAAAGSYKDGRSRVWPTRAALEGRLAMGRPTRALMLAAPEALSLSHVCFVGVRGFRDAPGTISALPT